MSESIIDMYDFVTTSYKEYGNQVNKNRMMTLSVDGLKPVERRVLYSAFSIAKDKMVKSVQVDGYCLGHFHPHSMCYGTIVQMVKQGFLDGQGQFGSNIGTDPTGPAASRYTECKLSKFTENLAFKLINYVPFIESEISADIKEPLFLPTKYPLCLIGKTSTGGIGFGYASLIPCYAIEDLKKRLLWLLKKRKTEPIIKPITDCDILSSDKDLKKLLTTGKASLEYKGRYQVDKVKNQIICKSLPPKVSYSKIYDRLQRKYKDLAIIDLSCDEFGTQVVYYLDRVRNQQQLFNELVNDFDKLIIRNVNFENNQIKYHDSNDVNHMYLQCLGIDEMLLDTFNTYVKIFEKMLNHQIKIRNKKIDNLKILSLIKDKLPKYLKDNTLKPTEIINKLSAELKLKIEIITTIFNKYTIMKLLKLKIDSDKLKEEIKELEDVKQNIIQHIINEEY
jgi:DNA gyrase subunit A